MSIKLIDIIKERRTSLVQESDEIRGKLSQINSIKSQLEQRYIQIQGSLNELSELSKILNVSEENKKDDTEHNTESESDNIQE